MVLQWPTGRTSCLKKIKYRYLNGKIYFTVNILKVNFITIIYINMS